MGYLTEIVLHNDRLHEFKKYPLEFAKTIFEGMDEANLNHGQASMIGGYINVEPSRHADHEVLFIHSGNMLHVIGGGEKDWEDLVRKNPTLAKDFYKRARNILKWAGNSLKKAGVSKK